MLFTLMTVIMNENRTELQNIGHLMTVLGLKQILIRSQTIKKHFFLISQPKLLFLS